MPRYLRNTRQSPVLQLVWEDAPDGQAMWCGGFAGLNEQFESDESAPSGFENDELDALARAFPPGPAAAVLLQRAGVPRELWPSTLGTNGQRYWTQVDELLRDGVIEDGRRTVMVAALRSFPYSPVFRKGAQADGRGSTRPRRVLVLGAGVEDLSARGGGPLPPIRADLESKQIQQAGELGHIAVTVRSAATVGDLETLASSKPDILHLICHGDGDSLTFSDALGMPHRLPADQLVRILTAYRDHAQVKLSGIVLNACRSAQIASLFVSLARTVVGHDGDLDDACAAVFAGRLYRTLRTVPSLAGAAEVAAEHVAGDETHCGTIRDGLVVLTAAEPQPAG